MATLLHNLDIARVLAGRPPRALKMTGESHAQGPACSMFINGVRVFQGEGRGEPRFGGGKTYGHRSRSAANEWGAPGMPAVSALSQ